MNPAKPRKYAFKWEGYLDGYESQNGEYREDGADPLEYAEAVMEAHNVRTNNWEPGIVFYFMEIPV